MQPSPRIVLVLAAGLAALALAAPATGSPSGPHWESLLPDLPPAAGRQPHAVPGCRRPTVRCIDVEARRLRRLQRRLRCDHRAVFATTYLELTRALRSTLRTRPRLFADRRYLYYEDALFAEVYFRTLRAYSGGREVAPAWRIALDAARGGDLNAGQDMLLGINAHVQNDMPFVIAALGIRTPDGHSRKPDHDAVNEVLAAAYERVVTAVGDRYDPLVTTTNASWNPLDDLAGLELVRGWREGVWRNAERLLAARDERERGEVAAQVEANAATWASLIATPRQSGYRAQRDAYCASKHATSR